MASTYKTPGVYVEEISKFPPSVAQVETAIPAFIGYTEKAENNGENLTMIPTRITSMLEYEDYFGGAYSLDTNDINVTVDETNNYSVSSVTYADRYFRMYDSLQMFFDNGGGPCYIVSVNTYTATTLFTNGTLTSSSELSDGLDELEKYDEPTIILFPDAVQLGEANFYSLQQAAIAQCAKLQDRVALLDLKENLASPSDWDDSVTNFRNNIGINDLKYAMAYTPWVYNSYTYTVPFENFRNNVRDSTNTVVQLHTISSDSDLNNLVITVNSGITDSETVTNAINTAAGTFSSLKDRYYNARAAVITATTDPAAVTNFIALLTVVRDIALLFPNWMSTGTNPITGTQLIQDLNTIGFDSINGLNRYVTSLVSYETNADIVMLTGAAGNYTAYDGVPAAAPNSWLGQNVAAIAADTENYGAAADRTTCNAALPDLDVIFSGLNAAVDKLAASAALRNSIAQSNLYSTHTIISKIVTAIQKQLSLTPPSGAVAGVYAKVDSERGVWKAPANVSLSSTVGPSVVITNDDQDGLNVDTEAGKSINAIRAFTGKGTLIWGARTLAGNDNEWRYVSVRRFFNMVEESVKKASAQFVFEPNDANTWIKVKAMIENFLTVLWRQGALAGAKPEHAFYVKVGLGETMTALDILEGRMNVEIGMAAVRPAEFIILKFSHKMQES